MWWRPVEHGHSAAVLARRVRINDTVPRRLAGVDSIGAIGLLEDAQVHVGLCHSPKCRLHPPVAPIPDIVSAESNRHPLPCMSLGTPPCSPPTDAFSLLIPVVLLTPACLPFRRSLSVSVPVGHPLPFPIPFPSSLPPLFYSVPFTSA